MTVYLINGILFLVSKEELIMKDFWEGFKNTIFAIVIGSLIFAFLVVSAVTLGMWVMILWYFLFGRLIIESWLVFIGMVVFTIVLVGIWGGIINWRN